MAVPPQPDIRGKKQWRYDSNAIPLGRVVIGDLTYWKHAPLVASTQPLANNCVRAVPSESLPRPPSEWYCDTMAVMTLYQPKDVSQLSDSYVLN